MKNKETRTYNSIVRQKQAEDTKNRIADTAEALIKENGYENTTIGDIAKKAGVATQTVYAIFNSKQGILTYLIKRSMVNANVDIDYSVLLKIKTIPDIAASLAEMMKKQGQEQSSIMNGLGGFENLYPEIAALITEASSKRRERLAENFQEIKKIHRFDLDEDKEKALIDIFWALTDSHFYFMLVEECNWPASHYQLFISRILSAVMGDIAQELLHVLKEK
ncbi:TetR/AcrR family transcriptional regulator [Desulfovibrio sp. OttesenSCG-928-F07]|nr:TetR/AcrR family transcriptional regulator [Desulfovibrio sp. OttesenSCG-928-F07]